MRVRLFVHDSKAPVRDIKGVKALVQQAESTLVTLEMNAGDPEKLQTDPAADGYVKYDVVRVSMR